MIMAVRLAPDIPIPSRPQPSREAGIDAAGERPTFALPVLLLLNRALRHVSRRPAPLRHASRSE